MRWLLILALLLVGCGKKDEVEPWSLGSDGDDDADPDSGVDDAGAEDGSPPDAGDTDDSGTDGGGDLDTDSDTDTDGDTDTETDNPNCPLNSGYPCTCNRPDSELCDDGNICMILDYYWLDIEVGVCAGEYTGYCPDPSPYTAGPLVHTYETLSVMLCALNCTEDSTTDCPEDQVCLIGPGIVWWCYPEVE